MTKELLDELKEDPQNFYIYELPIYIKGITESQYIVVRDEYRYYDPKYHIEVYSLKEWLNKAQRNEILLWMCACLSKKHIIKEHVKLMMKTDPLELRKQVDSAYKDLQEMYKNNVENYRKEEQVSWLIPITCFAIQIIENHKIVNYSEPWKYINNYNSDCSLESFNIYFQSLYNQLKKYTDGLLKKCIEEKANKQWKELNTKLKK